MTTIRLFDTTNTGVNIGGMDNTTNIVKPFKFTIMEMKLPVSRNVEAVVLSVKSLAKADFINNKTGDSKLKHDCRVITCRPISAADNKLIEVFVTNAQWDKYGIAPIMFQNNLVVFTLEEHIAGETNYLDAEGVMQTDTKSYVAFAGAQEIDDFLLFGYMMQLGFTDSICERMADRINTQRVAEKAKFRVANNAPAAPMSKTTDPQVDALLKAAEDADAEDAAAGDSAN